MSNIVVVEDNPSNMKLVKRILEHGGYKVTPCDDAEKGIILITQQMPSLVLMDLHMPGMNGIEATKILKKQTQTQYIPIIALTAKAMMGDKETILAEGFNGYISKPINYKELLKEIDGLLNP